MPSPPTLAPVPPGEFPPETAHLVAAWTEVRFYRLDSYALTDPQKYSLGPPLWCDNQYYLPSNRDLSELQAFTRAFTLRLYISC
jgi:hypothetical protein